jgi:isopentenyldiphosphate isomerase
VHRDGLWHRSFHCWIAGRDGDGSLRLVLQRRGPYKEDYPDRLDTSAAGHYLAGEGVDGGLREIAEELGIEAPASDLRPLAVRRIDETLYNGRINREFQDVYLLMRPADGLQTYRPSYPEVAQVLVAGLRDVLDLLAGKVVGIGALCHSAGPDGNMDAPQAAWLGLADFIPEAHAYMVCVLTLVEALASPGPVDPSLLESRTLDDGSIWTPSVGPTS